MSAVLDLPRTQTTSILTIKKAMEFVLKEQVSVILSDVSWETYDQFVQETMDIVVNPRFYFEKESLLIMPVTAEHESINRVLASLVDILAEEFQINSRCLGSATYQREDIERGFEPDSCFYFENEPFIRGVKRLDMTIHPAPDLIIEVDITSLSTNRQSIFAAFGVPEIWRFDGEKMQILKLEDSQYSEITNSLALPKVTAENLSEFLEKSETLNRLAWITEVRTWARNA
jgi:Uma2 family endonuclease